MNKECESMIIDQHKKGKLVSQEEAKPMLDAYLQSKGEIQPDRSDAQHIYGFLFGLSKVKELISLIDNHNIETTDPKEQITALRIYKAKSKREATQSPMSDLLIVPVKRSGEDYPKSLLEFTSTDMILCSSGPCPNICNQLYLL
jgi:hypothetical protein